MPGTVRGAVGGAHVARQDNAQSAGNGNPPGEKTGPGRREPLHLHARHVRPQNAQGVGNLRVPMQPRIDSRDGNLEHQRLRLDGKQIAVKAGAGHASDLGLAELALRGELRAYPFAGNRVAGNGLECRAPKTR